MLNELMESIQSIVSEDDSGVKSEGSQYTELMDSIKESFLSQFPNGYIKLQYSKRFGESIDVFFGLIGNIEHVSNKIRRNDPMGGSILIELNVRDSEFVVNSPNGGFSLNPEEGSYMAMKSLKFPFRAFKTNDENKLLAKFNEFFAKLKVLAKENRDNFYRSQDIPSQYFVESDEIYEGSSEEQSIQIDNKDLISASSLISKYPNGLRVKVLGRNRFSLILLDDSILSDGQVKKLFSNQIQESNSETAKEIKRLQKMAKDNSIPFSSRLKIGEKLKKLLAQQEKENGIKESLTIQESDSEFQLPDGYEDPKEVFSDSTGKVIQTTKDGKMCFFAIKSDGNTQELPTKTQAVQFLKK